MLSSAGIAGLAVAALNGYTGVNPKACIHTRALLNKGVDLAKSITYPGHRQV